MQYGQPNGELSTGNICNFGGNFQNVSHSQSTDQPAIKRRVQNISFHKLYMHQNLFIALGSISVTEGITNCMFHVRQMEDEMHLLFVVSLKNFLTTLLKSLSLAYLFFLPFCKSSKAKVIALL